MYIMVVGLNYKSAPVEIRERFALPESDLGAALERLRASGQVNEAVIVSTCNRTEVYTVVESRKVGEAESRQFLSELSGLPVEQFVAHLYELGEQEAVRHLFRVTAGLDSMVLGETQILGQVREAFLFAQEQGATGPIFNNLFRRAVTVAKRAHSETKIGENAVSVSYAAVELAKKIFESLNDKTVLIIGAGKMSELTAKHLNANGATRVVVVNRTYSRAKELADKFNGRALDMNSLDLALREADIVVSSTGAEGYVVTKEQVQATMKQRRHRPLFLIDIAVPRDLDPAMAKLDNVFLYDIDDLEGVIAVNLQERAREAEKVGIIIGEEMAAFRQWMHEQQAAPLIMKLREKAMGAQAALMQNLANKVPNLTEKERHTVNKLTMSMINQLIHEPIVQVKEMASEKEAAFYLETFARLFGLDKQSSEREVAGKKQSPPVKAEAKVRPEPQSTAVAVAVTAQIKQARQEEAPTKAKVASLLDRISVR
jgi:glutamyl-tRNA reductase